MVALDDAYGVNPKIPNTQFTGRLDGVLECFGQVRDHNAIFVLFDIRLCGHKMLLPSPTMGKCNVTERLFTLGFVHTDSGFTSGPEVQNSGWHRALWGGFALMLAIAILKPLTHECKVLITGYSEVRQSSFDTVGAGPSFSDGFPCRYIVKRMGQILAL